MRPFRSRFQFTFFLIRRCDGDGNRRFISIGDLEEVYFLRGNGGSEGLEGLGEVHVELCLGS